MFKKFLSAIATAALLPVVANAYVGMGPESDVEHNWKAVQYCSAQVSGTQRMGDSFAANDSAVVCKGESHGRTMKEVADAREFNGAKFESDAVTGTSRVTVSGAR